jgi:hypothetical protein
MKKLASLLLVAIIFSACNLSNIKDAINESSVENVKYKRVSYKAQFSLMVPEFTTAVTNLHEDASIQYSNLMKEFYVIVIKESKQKLENVIQGNQPMLKYFPGGKVNVGTYFNFVTKGLQERGERMDLSDTVKMKVNNLEASVVSATGLLNHKLRIFYRVGVLEGEKDVYQVFTWTMDKYRHKYQPVMDSIVRSMKEYH